MPAALKLNAVGMGRVELRIDGRPVRHARPAGPISTA